MKWEPLERERERERVGNDLIFSYWTVGRPLKSVYCLIAGPLISIMEIIVMREAGTISSTMGNIEWERENEEQVDEKQEEEEVEEGEGEGRVNVCLC